MNKFYLITPLVLCLLFGVYYYNFSSELKVREAEKKVAVEKKKAEDEEKKKASEKRARDDAAERTRKREEEQAKKDKEKKDKWDEQGREIAETTAKYAAMADVSAKKSADLEIQLAETRRRKETASREAFELTKQVELARIAKRNAELEIQRMTEMVIRRAADSSVARMPVLPPPPPPAK